MLNITKHTQKANKQNLVQSSGQSLIHSDKLMKNAFVFACIPWLTAPFGSNSWPQRA